MILFEAQGDVEDGNAGCAGGADGGGGGGDQAGCRLGHL